MKRKAQILAGIGLMTLVIAAFGGINAYYASLPGRAEMAYGAHPTKTDCLLISDNQLVHPAC